MVSASDPMEAGSVDAGSVGVFVVPLGVNVGCEVIMNGMSRLMRITSDCKDVSCWLYRREFGSAQRFWSARVCLCGIMRYATVAVYSGNCHGRREFMTKLDLSMSMAYEILAGRYWNI